MPSGQLRSTLHAVPLQGKRFNSALNKLWGKMRLGDGLTLEFETEGGQKALQGHVGHGMRCSAEADSADSCCVHNRNLTKH
jgi:hypothetical protein